MFSADSELYGREVWISDGTSEGTKLLADLLPGPIGSDPSAFVDLNGQILFAADDGVLGKELWDLSGLCLAPLHLHINQIPIVTGVYQARASIETGGEIIQNQTVQFIAGEYVELLPGFVAENQTFFTINIGNCGN